MARIIKMPGKDELPEGPRRDFVEDLRRYYRAAGRPPLRHVSKLIEGREDLKEVTASQETVRRILRGTVVPTDWNRVNAVFQVLCEVGDIDPDVDRGDGRYDDDAESNREYLRRLWDEALEEEPQAPPIPRPTRAGPEPTAAVSGFGSDDPWSTESPGSGFSDEPPF